MGGIQPQFGALFGPTKSICVGENLFGWSSALLRLSPIRLVLSGRILVRTSFLRCLVYVFGGRREKSSQIKGLWLDPVLSVTPSVLGMAATLPARRIESAHYGLGRSNWARVNSRRNI